jgi:hypothetical protein
MKRAREFTLSVLEAQKSPQVADHMLEAESVADFCLCAHKGLYTLSCQVGDRGRGSVVTNELQESSQAARMRGDGVLREAAHPLQIFRITPQLAFRLRGRRGRFLHQAMDLAQESLHLSNRTSTTAVLLAQLHPGGVEMQRRQFL